MVLSMEFSRQEYLCGLPFTSPGDLPSPGTEPGSLHCRQILYHLSHLPGSRVALFVLLQESCCCRCSGLHHDHYQLTLPRTVQETSVFSPFSPSGILCRHFEDVPSDWGEVSLVVLFIRFSLILFIHVFLFGCARSSLLLWLFPFYREGELLFSCSAWSSHRGGFSYCEVWALASRDFSCCWGQCAP